MKLRAGCKSLNNCDWRASEKRRVRSKHQADNRDIQGASLTPFAFASRTRNVLAASMSAAAVIALAVYVTAPVAAEPAIVARSQAAVHPIVSGVVKGDLRAARVTLTFRDAGGRLLEVRHPHVARDGAWHAAIPRHAERVLVVIHDDGQVEKALETIVPGRSLRLTALFGGRRTGLVPGLFPY